jgi:glycosyltransferase involved in cell wall biosynthesis
MTPTVSVITAALPSRSRMLSEAITSVNRQTLPPVEHLVGVDHARDGSAAVRNRIAFAATGDWLAFLDDDDVLYPAHLEILLQQAATGHDIVYSRCDVDGRPGWDPVQPFNEPTLRAGNYIPVTVLIRAELFQDVGGFRPSSVCEHGWEDWDLWLRLLDRGARFGFVDWRTWRYRLHAGSKTNVGETRAH